MALFYTHSYDSLETTGNLTLAFKIPFSTFDTYTFTMNGSHINAPAAAKNLSSIRVVPNPYIVTHELEPHLLPNQSSGRGERFVRFTHVPPGANISIFTVRGDLVRKLHQDNLYDGDVKWDLRTAENLDVAYGVYVYVVETANSGSTTGKLALIK